MAHNPTQPWMEPTTLQCGCCTKNHRTRPQNLITFKCQDVKCNRGLFCVSVHFAGTGTMEKSSARMLPHCCAVSQSQIPTGFQIRWPDLHHRKPWQKAVPVYLDHLQLSLQINQKSRGPPAPTSSGRPFGPLDFVLRALQALRPSDPRNGDWIVCQPVDNVSATWGLFVRGTDGRTWPNIRILGLTYRSPQAPQV